MNYKFTFNPKYNKEKNSRLRNRRGVADIISTMMLMAVTVTGASTLTYFMNDAFVTGNLGTVSTLDSSSLNLLLLAYDTRDSVNLLTLLEVDNLTDSHLCRASCVSNPDTIPSSGGTEFIVLQLQNNGLNSIFLEKVIISGTTHSWDSSTSGLDLDLSVGEFPADGMFSILSTGSNPNLQSETFEIQNGQIVNVLVKLDSSSPDIQLNKGIPVSLNTGGMHLVEFLIDSGDAR
ncbi:hypothetical protein C5F49_03905 [Nitrosopumilus oxyclinae]|uniref:Uncharacterized protein n=1 Tax=Nitrosopumilus oxyclinae TaxID=1959104 RepID=A0A7D5M641_9ARCH|nr:hypothetical protein [Nitrosopumilus oxyclinae]QLH05550.1 hypothetical protein C5F49_03905 [Nitrosopumilus oxyclinae]